MVRFLSITEENNHETRLVHTHVKSAGLDTTELGKKGRKTGRE